MGSLTGTGGQSQDRMQEFRHFAGKESLAGETMSQTQCAEAAVRHKGGRGICLENSEVSDSKTSISACSCGPECGPDKCEGRNRSVLVGWDSLRTKIFIFLFAAFLVWLVVYVPISLTVLAD